MKRSEIQMFFICLVVVLGSLFLPGAGADSKTYYAVEINGVVCGYSENSESPLKEGGREYIQSETNVFVMLSLLGSEFNSKIKEMSLLDPETRRPWRTSTVIEQGGSRLEFTLKVSDGEVELVSPRSREPKKIAVSPNMLIGGDELILSLKRDFIERRASEKSYDILEVMEEEVQRSTFRKVGDERLGLAGKRFQTVIIEQMNAKSGAKTTYWLAPDQDGFVMYTKRDRSVYLADRSVIDRIKVADMDASIFTKTNVAISDFQTIAFMKLKVRIELTGVVLTAPALNVPGQKFSGTVEKNVIEGVLEIEHKRYDGGNAPPFPARFEKDLLLKKYLEPDRFIESDDPVLVAKAREITAGAADSWQAAVRLSKWVAENIAYAMITNNSARRAFDLRSGECGAHSMLLTAFCRAVGIPARIVFGAMYVPSRSGGFGQHGWNEVYMNEAGWIPVDSTAYETDFVDSGHIRISEVQSVTASTFIGREITVLEHRLAGKAASSVDIAALDLIPYLGKFANPQGGPTFTVLEKEGNLVLDIPSKMVLPFSRADEKGRWRCKLDPRLYLIFKNAGQGRATGMDLHQVTSLRRKVPEEDKTGAVAGELAPYVGTYLWAGPNAEFTVLVQDGQLAIFDPMKKEMVKLRPTESDGGWREEANENAIFFEKDGQGQIVAMSIDAVDNFQRGEHAADRIERTIGAEGLAAGLKEYAELKKGADPEVLFSEGSFNQLGYRFLMSGELNEAIAVLKLNAEAFPASFNVYDSLGEAYMKNGQNDRAIENFKKSLELNPKNENAKKILETLTEK